MARRRANPGNPPASTHSVERKIYFYRVFAGVDGAGERQPYDFRPALNHISQLPFSSNGRYRSGIDGKDLCCWVYDPHDQRSMPGFALGTIRRTGLPPVEDGGALSDLPIPESSGLAEQTHALVLPNNIVGCEFNFHGPRLSSMTEYLGSIGGPCSPAPDFEVLLRDDAIRKLDSLGNITLFKMRIRASYASEIAQIDQSIGAALNSIANAAATEDIEIVLRTRPRSKRHLGDGIVAFAKQLLRLVSFRTNTSSFHVRGVSPETSAIVDVDLLSDKLVATRRIVRVDPRSRALNHELVFNEILAAYDELKDQLEVAAGVLR